MREPAVDLPVADGTEDPMPRPPAISLMLASAAMLPMAAGAVWSVWDGAELAARLTIVWAGSTLCFLAGVRRGLSFRQPGGATAMQLATMFVLFVLGAGSLLSPWPLASLLLQIIGYGIIAVADPIAARRREVPVYFQRLRPVQMLVAVVSLAVLALRIYR